MNLPIVHFLSAPFWLITTLHILTLTLHFIAMNLLVGGTVVVLFGKFENKWQNKFVQDLLHLFPNIMAVTITLGVAPLLFVQLVFPEQIYSASIVSAWSWLMIFVVAIVSYYFLYAASFTKRPGQRRQSIFLWMSLFGFLYISFIYSSVFSMAEHTSWIKMLYIQNQSGTVINPEIKNYIFRWLHMLLGAVTVGGFFVGVMGRKNNLHFSVGKQFFLIGMILSIISGLVYLLSLADILKPFMQSFGIWLVVISFVLSLGALHFYFRKNFVVSGTMLFVSLLSMVSTRHVVRLLNLKESYNPGSVPVLPQWDLVGLFALFFMIAIGVIYYMFRITFKNRSL